MNDRRIPPRRGYLWRNVGDVPLSMSAVLAITAFCSVVVLALAVFT